VQNYKTNIPKLGKLIFFVHTELHVLVMDHQCNYI